MTLLDRTAPATVPDEPLGAVGARGALGAAGVLLLAAAGLVVVAGWHVTQGTSGIGAGDLLRLVVGRGDDDTWNVLVASRLPRLLAGLLVGVALGAAGAIFQSLARNALASPDTLAVNAGAYFAATLAAALGLTLPLVGDSLVIFVGGLLAAGLVLLLAGGGAASTTRLILAGSALALGLQAAAGAMLLLFDQETTGLYAWGNGTLTQLGLQGVRQMGPVVAFALAAALLLSRRLDLLALGDDTASVLGVRVRRTRVAGTVLAVVLCACAVSLAGPIGFVGLCAPAAVRLLGRVVPSVQRHVVLVPLSALAGALIVLLADAGVRAALTAESALRVPTGVTTTILGAVVLIVLARRAQDAGPTRRPSTARAGRRRGRLRAVLVLVLLAALTAGALLLGLMAGYTWLLVGDLVNWASGNAVPVVEFAMDERAPRVAAALLGGAALALAGAVIQAVCRNPLAEPGILGITGGAGLGAVIVVTATAGLASTSQVSLAAGAGALLAFGLVYGLSWRRGLDSDRLVLVGVGVAALTAAVTAMILIEANPWDTPKFFTWMSGSTYDRQWAQVLPVLVALVVALPAVWLAHRHLDLLSLDDDTPRLVGVRLERTRLVALLAAAVLTSTAVSAVGVVAFVGLVAPHAARALVSGRHRRVVPVAVLLGAVLLSLADTIGRTAIAPAQVPAGLVVAAIGAPYFVYLLYRSRA
ncbi:iron ABC transporter permease [Nocardioides sp. cx-169]|uniref:iron ABC transporter permease n=1 Tax=Nocardioides sp. cx-169 TaxID=2899080 RepID=UPI001E3AF917|nr:iron ABC transporter permease [Nocardioides sp. cx-169]MCD4533979.1 iron ABC transporter permease [Nocardioides sp. cx-169]